MKKMKKIDLIELCLCFSKPSNPQNFIRVSLENITSYLKSNACLIFLVSEMTFDRVIRIYIADTISHSCTASETSRAYLCTCHHSSGHSFIFWNRVHRWPPLSLRSLHWTNDSHDHLTDHRNVLDFTRDIAHSRTPFPLPFHETIVSPITIFFLRRRRWSAVYVLVAWCVALATARHIDHPKPPPPPTGWCG
jgi:hypothetical protein